MKRLVFFDKEVQTEDEVLAEVMAEHVALKAYHQLCEAGSATKAHNGSQLDG
jgi:hypothetical protein